jgi:hypothetical protein
LSRRARRFIFFFTAILLGFGIGVVYGWVVNPVIYRNTGMETLRLDYKTDYVLMVSELYQTEGDVVMALARLAYFEEASHLAFVTTAIKYAEDHNYAAEDLELMWQMASAIDNALSSLD